MLFSLNIRSDTKFIQASPSSEIIFYIFMCLNFIIYIVLCQVKNQNILTLDIDVQNTTYIFASKGTQALYLIDHIKVFNLFNSALEELVDFR